MNNVYVDKKIKGETSSLICHQQNKTVKEKAGSKNHQICTPLTFCAFFKQVLLTWDG